MDNIGDMDGYLSVDRIEEGIAVLDRGDGRMLEMPISELPPDVREGDCLLPGDGGFKIDKEETELRRKRNIDLFKSLLEDR